MAQKKSRKAAFLMIAGALILIGSWALGIPARFQTSSLQAQSDSLAGDMTKLRAEMESAGNEPTATDITRLKEMFRDVENRSQELDENLSGVQRFEGLQMLGMAFGCMIISCGFVVKFFGTTTNDSAGARSDSSDTSGRIDDSGGS